MGTVSPMCREDVGAVCNCLRANEVRPYGRGEEGM